MVEDATGPIPTPQIVTTPALDDTATERERRAQLRREEREAERREMEEAAKLLRGSDKPPPPTKRQARKARRQLMPKVRLVGLKREMLRSALHSLSNNRLRSWLTMTGIIIGVAAVIVLVALGNGMKAHFNEQFSRLANQITITPTEGTAPGGGVAHDLTDRDVTALQDKKLAPDIASVSPSVAGTVTLTVGQNTDRASLVGATDNYLELTDRKIVAGTWLSGGAHTNKDREAVLGPQAVALLFGPRTNPDEVVGTVVRVDRSSFKITGILDSNGQNDNVVITPFEAARTYLVGSATGKVDQITLKSTDVATIDRAVNQASHILDDRHNIKAAANRDYNILTFTTLLNKSMQFINFLTQFIVAVAAISLIVGGIGVANIMLVSVTERTREIGIRKAVGATRRAVLQQFLSEAVILSGLGGTIGIVLGVGLTLGGGHFLPNDPESDFPHPILSPGAVIVAFCVSLLIGVIAGGYPAYRAGRLRPIEALRFE